MAREAPTEREVSDAVSVIKRDYYADVASIVEDLKRAIKDREITSQDEVHDWLHEAIDGTQRVIYTWQARLGMLVTDNDDAYQEEMGEPPPSVEAAMFMAMQRDVQDEVEREDILDDLPR